MITQIIFIFVLTLFLVGLLVPVGRYRSYHSRAYRYRARAEDEEPLPENTGVGISMLFFFFLLFPMILASSFWIGPYGPVFMGISWVPIVTFGVLLALLIAALSPRDPGPTSKSTPPPEEPVAAGIFAFFGLIYLIFLFAIAIVIVAAII